MKNAGLSIRPLRDRDVTVIADAFRAIGWDKPESQYRRYLGEQESGARAVLVAGLDAAFYGYVTVCWDSRDPAFKTHHIPEIEDLNVLPQVRRRGIGSALLDAAERLVAGRSAVVGIGVGVDVDYGPAQRLYCLRGYVPDGRGLLYDNRVL